MRTPWDWNIYYFSMSSFERSRKSNTGKLTAEWWHPVICSHMRRGLQCPPKVQLLNIGPSGWRCTEVEVGPSDSGPGGTDSWICGWILWKGSHSVPLTMRQATLLWDVTATMSLKGNQVNQPGTEKEINLFPLRVIISVTLIESWQAG